MKEQQYKKTDSEIKEVNKDYFIPKKEVIPNLEKSLTNPFKEADLLNANLTK